MASEQLIDEAFAARIADSIHGLHLHIPMAVIRKLDDLEAAAFVGLAVFLSGCCKDGDGWFFFEQEKEAEPDSPSMFRRLGSWRHALGLGKDAQQRARRKLEKLALLESLPSQRQRNLGNGSFVSSQSAFIFEQPRGAPPRLHYRIDRVRYVKWLGSV
ncbi:MAG: hypothetical protein Q7U97_14065 [Rhodocyclaceae bacterium]|nr:hypothetical protein [Rhodocyclaceae bacterium]